MTTHRFTPTLYYSTIGSHEPALRITDGDAVITTTVDAHGLDARGEKVFVGGNPQTGPFYVEDAQPGDTLAVRLERLAPNREYGWSRSALAANVVDPESVRELPARDLAEWRIDQERGTATLVKPEWPRGQLVLPIEPMLGCFGVAPANGEAISTATSGPNGGNMDYRGFCEGTTIYLPVAVPGALFFLGDGHALQGDGEVSGTGIEVSFDVQFTVHVVKGKRIEWPRGENAEFIFSVGNARPLDQALQHATTEMYRWLMADYGLDACGASILLGQCVRYEVANMYDPAYTVVCKMGKERIPS